jgi:hypothetical protein
VSDAIEIEIDATLLTLCFYLFSLDRVYGVCKLFFVVKIRMSTSDAGVATRELIWQRRGLNDREFGWCVAASQFT